MAFTFYDRVKETSTTTGTGSITPGGAATGGYQTFSSVFSTNDTLYYCIQDQTGSNWEVGLGTLTGSTTLARTIVLASSNSGSLVNFTSGSLFAFNTFAAAIAKRVPTKGKTYAFASGNLIM